MDRHCHRQAQYGEFAPCIVRLSYQVHVLTVVFRTRAVRLPNVCVLSICLHDYRYIYLDRSLLKLS